MTGFNLTPSCRPKLFPHVEPWVPEVPLRWWERRLRHTKVRRHRFCHFTSIIIHNLVGEKRERKRQKVREEENQAHQKSKNPSNSLNTMWCYTQSFNQILLTAAWDAFLQLFLCLLFQIPAVAARLRWLSPSLVCSLDNQRRPSWNAQTPN